MGFNGKGYWAIPFDIHTLCVDKADHILHRGCLDFDETPLHLIHEVAN